MNLLSRLHRGQNDKYFLLANTGWRSLSRFGVNVLVAKLAGAETYATLVLLLTADVIVTTLLSAWLVVPMMNTTSGSVAATRNAVGRYTLMRSIRWAGIVSLVALVVWAGIDFKGATPALAIGFALYVFMACVLQSLRAWRAVCFESWHVFWSDLIAFGLPIAAILAAHYGGSSVSLLHALVWSSAAGAVLASILVVGKQVKTLLQAEPVDEAMRARMASQSAPLLIGSIANAAGSRAYPILLAAIALSIEVARFGAVLTLIGPMRMVGMALSGVVRPRFALYYNQSDIASVRRLMLRVSFMIAVTGGLMAIIILFWGDLLCGMLFGDWLSGARPLLMIGVWYGTAACLGSFAVTALQTQSDRGPGYTARLRTGISASALLLALLMTGPLGALGPLLAMALTETVYVALAFRHWLAEDRQAMALSDATAA